MVDQYDLEFDYSDTRLKRMSKAQLMQMLAKHVEEGVKCDMATACGVDPKANGKVVGLGALRMIHNLCASGFEKGFNATKTYTGYELDGFCECLRDPSMQESIDGCLAEIARESPEILEYFDSPFARLALVWTSAALTCMRRRKYGNHNNNNNSYVTSRMGLQANRRAHSPGIGGGRGQALREVDSNLPPRVPNVRTV